MLYTFCAQWHDRGLSWGPQGIPKYEKKPKGRYMAGFGYFARVAGNHCDPNLKSHQAWRWLPTTAPTVQTQTTVLAIEPPVFRSPIEGGCNSNDIPAAQGGHI